MATVRRHLGYSVPCRGQRRSFQEGAGPDKAGQGHRLFPGLLEVAGVVCSWVFGGKGHVFYFGALEKELLIYRKR